VTPGIKNLPLIIVSKTIQFLDERKDSLTGTTNVETYQVKEDQAIFHYFNESVYDNKYYIIGIFKFS
jgi:hypothetical protein